MNYRIIAMLFVTAISFSAQAELVGRAPLTPGGTDYQAYFDTLLNATWLADGNFADSSGYHGSGYLDRTETAAFINHLNAISHLGLSTWRLPKAEPLNGTSYYPGGNPLPDLYKSGNSDYGWRMSAPGTMYSGSVANELAHLYYFTLENLASWQGGWSQANVNTGPFTNFGGGRGKNGRYSTSGQQTDYPYQYFYFSIWSGYSKQYAASANGYVWPITDGDPLGVIVVDIDIKPGSETNCFNVNGHGVIPVAVLGSETFDVTLIDQATLSFGGLAVRIRGKKGPLCGLEDTNIDGFYDLVCHFEDNSDYWETGNDDATLTGYLLDGTEIEGSDSICIVP